MIARAPRRRAGLALASAAACLAVAANARADTVTLTNGDRLTGRMASASSRELVLESELAGRVTLKWTAVSSLASTTEIRATLKGGQVVTGTLGIANRSAVVTASGGRRTPLDLSTLDSLVPATAGSKTSWSGAANADLDVSRGNADTSTLSIHGTVTRLGQHDRLGAFATFLHSTVGTGANAVTSARASRGGARYDHDAIGPFFGFVFGDIENDPLQLLDLRTVTGGGAGVHVVKSAATQFNVFAGASYARDAYTSVTTTSTGGGGAPVTPGRGGTPPGLGGTPPGLTRSGTPPSVVRTSLSRSVGELVVGQDLLHQLSDRTTVTEQLGFFPAVGDFMDYRISFDLSITAQLNSWLQWNLTVADRYLNIPPAGGAVQNDRSISTGLGISFGEGGGSYTGADVRRPAAPGR